MTKIDTSRWWIATGREQDGGRRVLGAFDTRDLALEVRALAEAAWDREGDLWVVTGDEVPREAVRPGFKQRRVVA